MKLPSNTFISPRKLTDYLLVSRKKNDKSKWLAQIGFTLSNWQLLENALRTQILILDAKPIEKNEFGQMYEIKANLRGPNGRILAVCTIWMTEFSTGLTKFITLFPGQRRSA